MAGIHKIADINPTIDNLCVRIRVIRYRIKLGVIDDSDCACFVVFDNEVKQILGKNCVEILDPLLLDVYYTGGLFSTSKAFSIIEGEKVEGVKIHWSTQIELDWSSMMRLTFHFPGEQNIIFKDDDDLEKIVEEEEEKCTIFQDACYSMGLLCDDREFITAINEVAELASGLNMTDDKLKNLCLIQIEKILNSNARSLRDYQSMPYPEMSDVRLFQNKLIEEELVYDTNELTHTNLYIEQKITHEQSEITSLLLPGGRTAHSRFSIPVTITDESTCNIKYGSLKAELLIQSSLIIWDEAPMLNKMCFEALDRMLMDLMSVTDQHKTHQPFCGKVIVLGGDFRQILPVIPKGSRHDILTSAINSSHMWSFCKVLKLHTNMRLLMSSSDQDEGEMKRFANWILDVGNGNIGSVVGDESEIEIPDDLLITTTDDPLFHLVDFTYPNLLQNMSDYR
ncbi:uncharacterized protein LOC107640198 [Arachis ipaensis]|uniref:uncharacterized protein LOC107640198 n=1 Tax=Arachis ipaensis TaxID=130454 RepID=UPI0007AF1299|nr:uncharacterized protein LOC107640198 [Arachis ipaensis]